MAGACRVSTKAQWRPHGICSYKIPFFLSFEVSEGEILDLNLAQPQAESCAAMDRGGHGTSV